MSTRYTGPRRSAPSARTVAAVRKALDKMTPEDLDDMAIRKELDKMLVNSQFFTVFSLLLAIIGLLVMPFGVRASVPCLAAALISFGAALRRGPKLWRLAMRRARESLFARPRRRRRRIARMVELELAEAEFEAVSAEGARGTLELVEPPTPEPLSDERPLVVEVEKP